MRLGFAVKVLGQKGLKSNDARRWQNAPHLRVSIEYVNAIFDYLAETKLSMYRISSDFAPYLTHPDLPQFHHQIEEAKEELVALGKRAREMNLRLSFHPSQYIVLNSPNEKLARNSIKDFNAQAIMLDIMEQSDEAVVVTHVGGVYGEREAAMQRFIERHRTLPEPAKRRLVLENDDVSWGVADVLKIHEATGIRCIFDHQHHGCINPDERDAVEACCAMLRTWPTDTKPKIHFSSPRIEARLIARRDKATGKRVQSEAAPLASQHDDYIDASVFVPFARAVACAMERAENDVPFDVMCEAKAKDLAVLQLRQELVTLAPDIAVA
ncbi:MAG: UV DNA damage repair endonuclease UvsE [Abitibacteriaceae bacterium]|nr:UV DNA damage repair endonuclease UvsE [Abditibacteriaceae bacterium]MBV9864404.1 UV DNA damage repair endonuclease UvsE [Abditibacteriaceae bacterium]